MLQNNRPMAIYNADKKELIGIFQHQISVGKFLFPDGSYNRQRMFGEYVRRKFKSRATRFPFPVAFRNASDEQVELLGNAEYLLMEGYSSWNKREWK